MVICGSGLVINKEKQNPAETQVERETMAATISGNGTRDDNLLDALCPNTAADNRLVYLVITPVSYATSDLDFFGRSEKVYDENVMVFLDQDEAYAFAAEVGGCVVREMMLGIAYNLTTEV